MGKNKAAESYVLFLHGDYLDRDIPFYRSLCKGRIPVAVDGGYSFFEKARLKPHILIGDFDSIEEMPSDPTGIEIIQHPQAKDETDGELALRYCLERSPAAIDIVQPSFGEPDQFFGNMMLLAIPEFGPRRSRRVNVRIVNPRYDVLFLRDTQCVLQNAIGDIVSVVPISRSIVYGCKGTEFTCSNSKVELGSSLAMRNRIIRNQARFSVKGTALLIHQFLRTRRKV